MPHNMKSRMDVAQYVISKYTPQPQTRAMLSNRFYQLISAWEALAIYTGAIPTITQTLRGNARSWGDQTWPRRLASIGVTVTIGMHLLGGYPKAYIKEIEEAVMRQAMQGMRAAGNSAAAAANHYADPDDIYAGSGS